MWSVRFSATGRSSITPLQFAALAERSSNPELQLAASRLDVNAAILATCRAGTGCRTYPMRTKFPHPAMRFPHHNERHLSTHAAVQEVDDADVGDPQSFQSAPRPPRASALVGRELPHNPHRLDARSSLSPRAARLWALTLYFVGRSFRP